MVRASDLQPISHRFESRPLHFMNNPRQVIHTHVPLFTNQYKFVPVMLVYLYPQAEFTWPWLLVTWRDGFFKDGYPCWYLLGSMYNSFIDEDMIPLSEAGTC